MHKPYDAIQRYAVTKAISLTLLAKLNKQDITLYINRKAQPQKAGDAWYLEIAKEFSEYRTYFIVRNGEVVEDRRK